MRKILRPKYINDTALDILRREGVFLCADCGGQGTCGKCRIKLVRNSKGEVPSMPSDEAAEITGSLEGPVTSDPEITESPDGQVNSDPEITEAEKKVLTEQELADGLRLACCLKVGELTGRSAGGEGGIEVEIPERSLIRDTSEGDVYIAPGGPGAEGASIAPGGPGAEGASVAVSKLEQLTPSEIIAVDYGTTVVYGELVDLNRGVTGEASVVNHQKAYGADVISRIRAANDGFREELRHVSEDDLAELTIRLGKDPDRARYIISGNTVMGHLISGFSCKGLGEHPYTPVDISLRRDENKTFLPGISAFVGSDIVSGICACSLDQAREPWLYVDIGTNGEIAIGTGSRIIAASAPAGPAFEGGGLSCGVPAIPGAVSRVVIAGSKPIPYIIGSDVDSAAEGVSDDMRPEHRSSAASVGICGSGAIDAVAELYKNRLIDENGTLTDEYAEEGFPIDGEVLITQKDIREIQKAKAAIRAGIETLILKSGVRIGDIRKFVIAGSFGSSMYMDNAARIGLIPEELLPVSATAGNSSLTGATLYALDTGFGARLEKLANAAETIELSETPEFGAKYISYMGF